MHQKGTEILCADVRTAIYLLTCLYIYSIETSTDSALEEMAASDTFLALNDSVDETTFS